MRLDGFFIFAIGPAKATGIKQPAILRNGKRGAGDFVFHNEPAHELIERAKGRMRFPGLGQSRVESVKSGPTENEDERGLKSHG